MKIRLVLVFILLLVFFVPTNAQRGAAILPDSIAPTGNTYAIIIGISKYKIVSSLQYADRDAQAFESFLLSEAGGKVPQVNIETFLNEHATRDNVADAISIIARKAKAGDRVYFFFAGHGDMEDLTQIENGLLLLYNSPSGNYFGMKDDVLEILDLKRYLSPLATRGVEMMFIVDACHSGNLNGGVQGSAQTANALAASWGKEYKILSCQPNQLSLESKEWGGGRGLFSLQLEEGMKGLADANGDGKISMFEIQSYIQSNVAKYSEFKQIPIVSGDLSKSFFTVDPQTLAVLKKQKEQNYPMLAVANTKGNEEKYVDSLDAGGQQLYRAYQQKMKARRLLWPIDTNALKDYREFEKHYNSSPLLPLMRRNLAAALNGRFDSIVMPLLRGETSYSTRDECYYAAGELDSCLHLLGEYHYMYSNIKARKLYMDAMALTWALDESEYNISLKPTVESSIKMLEESEQLEPNAAYTLSALGTRYFFVYEFKKAFAKFEKYLELRPTDYWAQLSLGKTYMKLKQYDKAEGIYQKLIKRYPNYSDFYWQLAETYFYRNRHNEALQQIKKIDTEAKDKGNYYFYMGIYYAKLPKPDSAVYFYHKANDFYKGNCTVCENNIGHVYLVNNVLDSARKYFTRLIQRDSNDAFPSFNLGTLATIEGDFYGAIGWFIKAINNTPESREGFITHPEMYFNKKYHVRDSNDYRAYTKKSQVFNIHYEGYLSILYCFLREPDLREKEDKIELAFKLMFENKEFDVLSWYHHACWRAMKNDKEGAIASLEKSLKLGFGSYFQLMGDMDLDNIRDSKEFQALMAVYFPEGK